MKRIIFELKDFERFLKELTDIEYQAFCSKWETITEGYHLDFKNNTLKSFISRHNSYMDDIDWDFNPELNIKFEVIE